LIADLPVRLIDDAKNATTEDFDFVRNARSLYVTHSNVKLLTDEFGHDDIGLRRVVAGRTTRESNDDQERSRQAEGAHSNLQVLL
jgi:hypothetical protein